MARVPRFIIRVSDSDRLETAWTYCEAWCRALELYRPGVTVTCQDREPFGSETAGAEAGPFEVPGAPAAAPEV